MSLKNHDRSRVTIYDVADHAGVSVTTVSRVLNDSEHVSEMTRAVVLDSVRELRFRPDRAAKSLAQSQQTIAVAVPEFTSLSHTKLMKGIRDRLVRATVDLLLCDLTRKKPRKKLTNFLSRGVMDGLLLADISVDKDIAQELEGLGVPVVLVGSQWPSLDSFFWKRKSIARMATEHLIDRGHERIGIIAASDFNRAHDARIAGYREALETEGVGIDNSLIINNLTKECDGPSEEGGYEAMIELLHCRPPVTAVFSSSPIHAIGAWRAIRDSGYSVPEECALVGTGDLEVSRSMGLSTVVKNVRDVGERAVDLLLQRLRGKENSEPVSQFIQTELRVRRSS